MNTQDLPAVLGPVQPTVGPHTPGPWYADGHHVLSPGNFDAYVRGVRYDAQGDFSANAQLMAAAPDLLGALQRLVCSAEDSHWPSELAEIVLARSAIARAIGEA